MTDHDANPWIPPATPDLARLAWEAADTAGITSLRDWPIAKNAGIEFAGLPVFLCWRAFDGAQHVILVQPREIGALVPGARLEPLPLGWLESLDLDALARPLAIHPDFGEGASIHVVHLPKPHRMCIRTFGVAAPEMVTTVLERLTGISDWKEV